MNIEPRFLTKLETLRRVRLSASTVDRLEKAGLFPRRRKLGMRKVGWSVTELARWEETRPVSTLDVPAGQSSDTVFG